MAKVRVENIMQTWDTHIPGQWQKVDKYFDIVNEEFQKKKTGLNASWENVGSMLGSKKKFLSIGWGRYRCYIGANAFGTDLVCTWDLYDPNFVRSNDGKFSGLFKSEFNEMTDLKAFTATILSCAITAADKIFDEANLDKKGLKQNSSGSLGPV